MELIFNKSSLAKEIGQSFNRVYPYLKIEIFNQAPKENSSGNLKSEFNLNALSRVLKLNKAGEINIDHNRTVAQLEKDFKDKYNLFVQVFRKSGNLWIETTLTEDWTLERQNKEGEIFSTPAPPKSIEQRLEDIQFDMD